MKQSLHTEEALGRVCIRRKIAVGKRELQREEAIVEKRKPGKSDEKNKYEGKGCYA